MAEGFELYHVPQQSRRDKLRVSSQDLQGCAGLFPPFYDPNIIPAADLLTCASATATAAHVKEEGNNFITSVPFLDPNNNNNPFFYYPQNFRLFDHNHHHHQQQYSNVVSSGGGGGGGGGGVGELMMYRPEPLALSLSSHNTHQNIHPLELNSQRYDESSSIYSVGGGGNGGGGGGGGEFRSAVPLGPFTGYASILKGSKFLKPAQELLEEICEVGCGINYGGGEESLMNSSSPSPSPLESCGLNVDDPNNGGGGDGRKKSRLISMLDEVYKRYKQYHQQMQAVVASFEAVPGLSNAAPFANLALKAMSKHFRCLKSAITDQLQFTAKPPHSHMNFGKEDTTSGSSDRGFYGQRSVNNLGFADHHHQQPVWRPQRGLPERAVTVLRSWLFDHFLHPYPTDTDKLMLAKQTGLSRNQVSNWFINARVRLWKPMVEEIHSLETRQVQKTASQREELQYSDRNNHLPQANSFVAENPSTSTQMIHDLPSKRSRNDYSSNNPNPMGPEEPMSLFYDNFSRHRLNIGGNNIGGSSSVSLTLGLHQNNVIGGLSEPFPMNAARRFGLDPNNEGFAMGGFEVQNRQYERDIIGGQLLHDFVG